MDLAEDEAHVWVAIPERFATPERVAWCESLLDESERARRNSFRFEDDAHHYRVAHALVRAVLSRYAGCDPAELRFQQAGHGKPVLVAPRVVPELEFNLTHTKGLVACGIARRPIGVDAEPSGRQFDEAVARRVLQPGEIERLNRFPAEARRREFLRYWTLKEACMKATGLGFRLEPRGFAMEWPGKGEEGPIVRFGPKQIAWEGRWAFKEAPGASRTHLLSVAVRDTPVREMRFRFEGFEPA